MAPRGGSHTSSGGSGSTDDGSGSGVWLASSDINGYGFLNGFIVVNIVFNGIWMLTLCAIAVWAMGIDRRSEVSHSVLGWKKYGIAITLMLIYYAFSFAQNIIQTNGGSVANVYFLLADIFSDFQYPATTWLLLTIYSLLFHCCIISDQSKRSRHRSYFKVHVTICVVTLALWIAILVFNIAQTSSAVNERAFDPNIYVTSYTGLVGFDLDAAYQAVLLAAAVEVLIFALWLPSKARQHGKEYYTASLLFLRLVAIPFFILRIFYLAYAAAFELSKTRYESWGAYIVFTLFTGAATIVIFVGVIIVSRRLERLQLWQQGGNHVPAQPPVNYWPAPIAPTTSHYSYGPVSPFPATSQTYSQPFSQHSQPHSQELHGQGQATQEMPVYHIQHEKPVE